MTEFKQPTLLEQQRDITENKLVAALSYVWILCLVPLLLKKNSEYCQFHAKQGLVLFVVEVLGWLVMWIPFIGFILGILIVILAILGFINALQGKYWDMPFLSEYAKKINLS